MGTDTETSTPEPSTAPRQATFYGQVQELIAGNWHLGLTCFGGPPTHFKIVGWPLYRPEGRGGCHLVVRGLMPHD